jgi:hypothetical protein
MADQARCKYYLVHVYVHCGAVYLVAYDVESKALHRLSVRSYREMHLISFPEEKALQHHQLSDVEDALRTALRDSELSAKASSRIPFEGAWRNQASEAVVEVRVAYVRSGRTVAQALTSHPELRGARYLHPQDTSEGRFFETTGLRVGSCFTCTRAPTTKYTAEGDVSAFAALYSTPAGSLAASPEDADQFDVGQLRYAFLHATAHTDGSVRAVHVAVATGGRLEAARVFESSVLDGGERGVLRGARSFLRSCQPALLFCFKNPLPHSSPAVRDVLQTLNERSARYQMHGWGAQPEQRAVWPGTLARGLAVVDLHANLANSYVRFHSHTLAALRAHPKGLRDRAAVAAAAAPQGAEAYTAEWLEVHAALQFVREQSIVQSVFAQARLYCATVEVNQLGPQAAAVSPFLRELACCNLYRNECQYPLLLQAEQARVQEAVTNKGYAGGFVRADAGLYGLNSNDPNNRGLVFVYDFASMYPAIIRALQLCPSSIYDGDEAELEVLLARGEIRGARVAVNDSADVFRVDQYRDLSVKGCLPNIILRGVEARKGVRARLAQLVPTDPFTATLEALQQQIKRLTNAWYGLTGNEGSILTHVVTAAATTRRGREDIQRAEQYIVDRESSGELPAGTRVVYMDTDSCFVFWPLQDLEGLPVALACAKKLLTDLNSLYCAPCKMELERVFTQINIRGKKKYTGLGGEASEAGVRAALEGRTAPISKGMVANKRSVCALVAAASSEVEAALLRDQPLEVVLASVERYAASIQERTPGSVDSFILSCALAREYTNEETTVGPRLKRRYKARLKFDLAARTRVPYVVVKGSGLLADRVRFPDEVSAAELDTEYYLKQLASTLRQTCEGYAAVGGAVAAALAKAIGQNRAKQTVSAAAQRALSVLLRPRQPAQNAAPALAAAVPATPATAALPQESPLPAPKRPATSHAVPFAKRPRLTV